MATSTNAPWNTSSTRTLTAHAVNISPCVVVPQDLPGAPSRGAVVLVHGQRGVVPLGGAIPPPRPHHCDRHHRCSHRRRCRRCPRRPRQHQHRPASPKVGQQAAAHTPCSDGAAATAPGRSDCRLSSGSLQRSRCEATSGTCRQGGCTGRSASRCRALGSTGRVLRSGGRSFPAAPHGTETRRGARADVPPWCPSRRV